MAQLQLVNVDLLIEELCNELPLTDNFELQILTPLPKLTTSYLYYGFIEKLIMCMSNLTLRVGMTVTLK